jgi:methanogenic corrinoid protein MtbC1
MGVFIERTSGEMAWRGGTAGLMQSRSSPTQDFASAASPAEAGIAPGSQRSALLRRLVATEILPRLALARRPVAGASNAAATGEVTTDMDTEELVRLLLLPDAESGMAFIERLLARGVTPEALYSGTFAEAARCLGRMWDEDRCDFAQVTIAVGRLQQAARMISPLFQAAAVSRAGADSVLLLPAPGEQHTFGLLILAEYFQRAGWRVLGGPKSGGPKSGGPKSGGPKSGGTDPVDLARRTWFDVAGFSIGSERLLDDLAKTIRRVRRASCNRGICVIVGGPLLLRRPELAVLTGADATAADAAGAVRLASDLLTMRAAAD